MNIIRYDIVGRDGGIVGNFRVSFSGFVFPEGDQKMGKGRPIFIENFEIQACLPGVAIKILAIGQKSTMYD